MEAAIGSFFSCRPHIKLTLGTDGCLLPGVPKKGRSIHVFAELMPSLSRSRLVKGKPRREDFKPHVADTGTLEEAVELERVDFVRVATTLESYETPPTVNNDAMPEIVARFVHPRMMRAVLSSLEAEDLLNSVQISGTPTEFTSLAAMWSRV